MDNPANPNKPLWPNNLRQARDEALMTRAQLSLRCAQLADGDPIGFSPVSSSAIRDLEFGETRPRRGTAVTLSRVLGTPVPELFPLGLDDAARNPDGHTRVVPGRRKGGRPRKTH